MVVELVIKCPREQVRGEPASQSAHVSREAMVLTDPGVELKSGWPTLRAGRTVTV